MRILPLAVIGIATAAVTAAWNAGNRLAPPKTVGLVDLARYAGTWHEVARIPNVYQDRHNLRCIDVTATYEPRPDGTVSVVNRCLDAANGGAEIRAEGYARSVSAGNDKLRVTFLWPFFGDYWVIGLDDDYQWAAVGSPNRRFLWILSRDADMPTAAYSKALAAAGREGFDIGLLQRSRPATVLSSA